MNEETTGSQATRSGEGSSMVPAHLLGLASFLVLQAAGARFPWLIETFLLIPAGRLSSLSLGIPVSVSEEGIRLYHSGIEVAITEACSGFDFFCLVAGLWLGWVFHAVGRSPKATWLWIVTPFVAWLVTMVGNVSRIVCATKFRALTSGVFPPTCDGVIHQSIGVLVFLSTLIAFWILLTKPYERFSRT